MHSVIRLLITPRTVNIDKRPDGGPSFSLFFFSCDNTYIGFLFVVVDVVKVPCQTEVSNFEHLVFYHKNVSRSEVTMYALQKMYKM